MQYVESSIYRPCSHFCDSKMKTFNFLMQKECFAAINKLRKNTDDIITNSDKGLRVTILNKCNYIKMENILVNLTKFEHVRPASSCNNISGILSLNCRNFNSNCSELIYYPKMYADLFILQAPNNHGCTGYLKFTNLMSNLVYCKLTTLSKCTK